MSLTRFLLHKRGFHLNDRGLVKSTRWCSSSSPNCSEKKKPAQLEEPASEFTASSNSVGEVGLGSGDQKKSIWYAFEGLLSNLKAKVLGNTHGKNQISEKADSPIFTKSSEVPLADVSSDKANEAEVHTNAVKSADETLEAIMYPEEEDKQITGNVSSHIAKRKVSLKVVESENNLSRSELAPKKVKREVSEQNKNGPKVAKSEDDSLAWLVGTVLNEQSRTLPEETPETRPSKQKYKIRVKDSEFDKNKDSDNVSFPDFKSEALGDTYGAFLGKNKRDVLSPGNEKYELDDKTFDFSQEIKANNSNMSIVLGRLELEDNQFKEICHGKRDEVVEGMGRKSLPVENSKQTSVPVDDSGEDEMFGIKSLMSCINDLPKDFKTHVAVQSPVRLQNSNVKRTKNLLEDDSNGYRSRQLPSRKEDGPIGIVSETAHGQEQMDDACHQNNVKSNLYAISTGDLAANTVLVRFLGRKFTEANISTAFHGCGRITDIKKVASTAGCKFRDALVTLETSAATKKALEITDFRVRNQQAVVEAISMEEMPDRLLIPDLIGDPDVPIALVKNPTRTVKIRPLTRDMSSNQVKEALAFCGGSTSGFFLGSSSSVAFVEFETELAKERALAEHSISILGKRLRISRIDAPRTTVLRISHMSPYNEKNLISICESCGKLEKVVVRSLPGIIDVHFQLSEWPIMLNILNRLNGKVVDGKKWIVAPAPVFAPVILHLIWNNPDEKKHLWTLVENLSRKFEGFAGTEERGIFSQVLKRMT